MTHSLPSNDEDGTAEWVAFTWEKFQSRLGMTFSRSSRHSTNCQLPGKKCSGTFRWIGLCVLYCCDTLPFNPTRRRRLTRLLADVDPHVGAGPAGNYPLSKRIGELDFSIVSTSLPCGPLAPEVIYNWAISKEELIGRMALSQLQRRIEHQKLAQRLSFLPSWRQRTWRWRPKKRIQIVMLLMSVSTEKLFFHGRPQIKVVV